MGDVLSQLPPSSSGVLATSIGMVLGARMSKRAGGADALRKASLEESLAFLATEFALAGLGSVEIERWGRALVFVVKRFPWEARFAATLVGAVMREATGATLASVLLHSDEASVRVLIVSPAGAARVEGWLKEGVRWADAIARLHAEATK